MLGFTPVYRKLFNRKGYGVHSPFVFDLITNVVADRCAYYSCDDIALIRKQLTQTHESIHCNEKEMSVSKAVKRYGISRKEGDFLFRLTNHYKPRTILATGSSLGLTPLYLSRYDSTVTCMTLESEPDFARMAAYWLNKETNPSLQIRTGVYHALLPESLAQLKRIDCLFIDKNVGIGDMDVIISRCLPLIHADTFCVLAGIRSSSAKYDYWKQLCQHPQVTVAVDMFQMGLLFFNPKLHKRIYKTII